MAVLPEPVQNLIVALERLPGVGPKTASRLAFFLLRAPDEVSRNLADALQMIKSSTGLCKVCFNITRAEQEVCEICASSDRDASQICVVEEPLDVLALERTGGFNGRYHVLHGVLSPIEGIGPEDLKIRPLIERVSAGGVREVIVAGCAHHPAGSRAAGRRRLGIRRSEYAAARPGRAAGFVLRLFPG